MNYGGQYPPILLHTHVPQMWGDGSGTAKLFESLQCVLSTTVLHALHNDHKQYRHQN